MSAAHPDTQSSGSVTCCLLLRTHKNRPRQLRRTDTVCSHVGTNRKQPALTYPGPAPWESGWREPNAHASLAESARCPPFWAPAACVVHLAARVRSTGELFPRLGRPAATPACHGFSQPRHLQTRVPPAVSRPWAAEPSPLSTLAVTRRSPTFSRYVHHAPCGYQRSQGLLASSGPGEATVDLQ